MSMSTGSDVHGWAELAIAAWESIEYDVRAQSIIQQVTYASTFALLLYEYATTLDLEIDYAWGRKLTWARAMFFLNRYITLLQFLAGLGSAFLTPSDFSCIYLTRTTQTCTIILYIVWAIFSGIRVYTITGCNKTIAALVLFLGLVPVVTSLTLDVLTISYTATTDPIAYLSLPGISYCSIVVNVTYRDILGLGILTRITLILSEGIVIVATMKHNWATYRGERHSQSFMQSYVSLVLREGVLYFVAQCVINVVQIVSDIFLNLTLAVTCTYLNLLPSILIARFYFHLHIHERGVQSVQSAIQQKVTSRWKPLPQAPHCEDADEDSDKDVHYVQEVFGYTRKRAVSA
ncbi:hypothetical protein C8Q74DRAFT_1227882, partial [Fomes fomentarius]